MSHGHEPAPFSRAVAFPKPIVPAPPSRAAARSPESCYVCGGPEFRHILSLHVTGWDAPFHIWRCTLCRLEFLWPVAPPHEHRNIYDEAYYREGYLALEPARRARFQLLLERLERSGAGGPLLDIGAGTGLLVSTARRQGWEAEGIEPSADGCRLANERYAVKLQQSEVSAVPSRPVHGVVILWQVLAHAPDPQELLCRAAAMLRPAGLLVISVVNWRDPHYRLGMLLARRKGVNAVHCPAILWRFDRRHLQTLAHRAGLRIKAVRWTPRAWRPRFGWKREALEAAFRIYRAASGTAEELEIWCTAAEAAQVPSGQAAPASAEAVAR